MPRNLSVVKSSLSEGKQIPGVSRQLLFAHFELSKEMIKRWDLTDSNFNKSMKLIFRAFALIGALATLLILLSLVTLTKNAV